MQNKHYRRPWITGIAVFAFFLFLGLGCRGGTAVIESLPKIELEYWTVWDDSDDFQDIITAYRTQHPNVSITVRKMPFEGYRQALLEAWAKDEGPDLFSIPNSSVGSFEPFVAPLPKTLALPTLSQESGCSKDIRVMTEPKNTPPPERLDDTFLPVVTDDVVRDNTIFGLPLATDSLALFYNKDILNSANIIAPPRTWQEFADMIDRSKSSLVREENGSITQAGAAFGTAENVNRSVDLVSVLMMQSGSAMVNPTGTAVTITESAAGDPSFFPGRSALTFYTAFADPGKVTYTWNEDLPNAQEAFASGAVAFFFGYSYQAELIRLQNPKVNFSIAPLPQLSADAQVHFAHYWVETVAKKTEHVNEAWDFILFATAEANVKTYLEKTNKPTALKSLLAVQRDDLELGVFANQALLSKNWYHGSDDTEMESGFTEMITSTLAGTAVEDALKRAADRIQLTLKRP